jgi:hypothetical protein
MIYKLIARLGESEEGKKFGFLESVKCASIDIKNNGEYKD